MLTARALKIEAAAVLLVCMRAVLVKELPYILHKFWALHGTAMTGAHINDKRPKEGVPMPRLETMNADESSLEKKLTQLTVEEDRAREKAVDFYRYVGKSEVEADRLAWADIEKAFPRLKGMR